jgi:hypothetical protein
MSPIDDVMVDIAPVSAPIPLSDYQISGSLEHIDSVGGNEYNALFIDNSLVYYELKIFNETESHWYIFTQTDTYTYLEKRTEHGDMKLSNPRYRELEVTVFIQLHGKLYTLDLTEEEKQVTSFVCESGQAVFDFALEQARYMTKADIKRKPYKAKHCYCCNNYPIIVNLADENIYLFNVYSFEFGYYILFANDIAHFYEMATQSASRIPELMLYDFDGDGIKELAVVTQRWQGSKVWAQGLYVIRINEATSSTPGAIFEYCPSQYEKQANALIRFIDFDPLADTFTFEAIGEKYTLPLSGNILDIAGDVTDVRADASITYFTPDDGIKIKLAVYVYFEKLIEIIIGYVHADVQFLDDEFSLENIKFVPLRL